MDARAIIAQIRDGSAPPPDQIAWFAAGLASGAVSDAQAGAFAMAVLLKGLGEVGRVALTTAGFAPRARTEGDPAAGWLDVDLPAGQAALDVTRLPGKLTLAGLTQGQCATVAGPSEAPAQEPVATPPADAPVDAPSEAASAGKPLAG